MGRTGAITLEAFDEILHQQGEDRTTLETWAQVQAARCLAQISEDLHALVQIVRVNEIFVMANVGGDAPRLSVGDVVAALSRGHEEANRR